MLLGNVIASFEDPACAAEALLALDDLALAAAITAAAAKEKMTAGEFAMQSVGAFVDGASDEEWLTLVGLMSRADNPGQVFLRRILSDALAARAAG
jgi:hypothetical protein